MQAQQEDIGEGRREQKPDRQCAQTPACNEKNIDILRALAVSCVVLHHMGAYLGFRVPILYHLTIIDGVSLFFVLSGYLISKSAERHDLRSYIVHRIFRIYPAFLVAFVIVGMLTIPNWSGRVAGNPQAFIIYLLLLQHLFPQALVAFSTLHVEWTLTLEILWYAIAFPLMRLSKGGALIAAVLVLALSAGWYGYGISGGLDALYGGRAAMEAIHPNFDVLFISRAFPAILWLFFIGYLVYRFESGMRRLPSWALVAACAVWLAWSLFGTDSLNPAVRNSLGMGALLLLALRIRTLNVPVINWISDVSYSIYLLHAPVFILVAATLGIKGPLGAAVALPIVLLASTLLYVLVEQPSMRFARTLDWRVLRPRPGLALARWRP